MLIINLYLFSFYLFLLLSLPSVADELRALSGELEANLQGHDRL